MIGKTISAAENFYGYLVALYFTDGTAIVLSDYEDSGVSVQCLTPEERRRRAAALQGGRERVRLLRLCPPSSRKPVRASAFAGAFQKAWHEEVQALMNQPSSFTHFGDPHA